jgi:hypothetical protein
MKDLLERVEVPDAADAEERAWRVVSAAHESGVTGDGSRVTGLRPRLAFAALVAVVAIALTPPGGAVARWVQDRFEAKPEPPVKAKPALTRLPGGGRLLVSGAGGAWVVHADGSRRRLGPYEDATWSPHGLFVGVTRGRELSAVTPGGTVRWVVERPHAVSDPRWAPSGFRVAYREGDDLRVVAGDGTGDRLLARGVGAAAARRPGPANVLTDAADNRLTTVDVDTGRVLWRRRARADRLLWSADGRRLLVLGDSGWDLRSAHGKLLERGSGVTAAAFAPTGHAFALVSDGSVLLGGRRLLFRGAGRFDSVAWSPDGRLVVAGWPSADQWLFLRVNATRAPVAVDRVTGRFGPATRIDGWAP